MIYDKIKIFTLLMKNISIGETVIVYHSLLNMNTIRLMKILKKIKIIMEVEEIYNDVLERGKNTRDKEISFIKICDAYLFPTKIMDIEINKEGKKSVIVHGTYKTSKNNLPKFNDGKIHVVYAGTFETKKGGVLMAINSAQYLPEEYKLHILGFGTELEIMNVKKRIKEIESTTKCEIVYEGKKIGKEYTDFISMCDIGLSSQNPEGIYNNTSFPSKILSYMCNGLKVVSIRIPVVETSDVKDGIWFYETNEPQKLAKAIQEAGKTSVNLREIIQKLNIKFENAMKELLDLYGV